MYIIYKNIKCFDDVYMATVLLQLLGLVRLSRIDVLELFPTGMIE